MAIERKLREVRNFLHVPESIELIPVVPHGCGERVIIEGDIGSYGRCMAANGPTECVYGSGECKKDCEYK